MVLACFADLTSCSCVSSSGRDELACDEAFIGNNAVTLLHFHPCESPYAFLRSLFALALTFRRLAHLRQVVTGLQLSEYQVKYVHQ